MEDGAGDEGCVATGVDNQSDWKKENRGAAINFIKT